MPSQMNNCANPLLLTWVGEWLETARERSSKGVTTYKKAYDSLKANPLPFTHPSQCSMLTGFGDVLCRRLTDKLRAHCEENGLPMPKVPRKEKRKQKDADEDGDAAPKKKPKTKGYVPRLRSGPYAIIIALSTLDEDAASGISKTEIIELAQEHCDSSFTAPEQANKFFTAWNSMKTLITKEYVEERGRPKKYQLTEDGWEVAKRINKSHDPSQGRMDTFVGADPTDSQDDSLTDGGLNPARPNLAQDSAKDGVPDIVSLGESLTPEAALPTFTPVVLEGGSFTVELVLDIREIRAKTDRDYLQNNLATNGVTPIMRALALGDILWVAKMRDPTFLSRHGGEGDEVLLDYIVERKRLDDLVSSIKDGRYREQKFRLRKSGIKNIIYVIEEFDMNADHFQRYQESVQSAIASSQVVEGIFVKKTQKMDDTIRYLVSMTKILKQKYEGNSLHMIPTKVITASNYRPLLEHLEKEHPDVVHHITYAAFASLSSKSNSLTLRDVYLKMLMCTRGITGEKALEIQKIWKTPYEFLDAYRKIEEKEGTGEQGRKKKIEMISNEMAGLVGRKKIARVLSGKLAEVWGDVVL